MTDITIPPEAVEAAARAAWGYEGTSAWERAMARKIIAAAINAWPDILDTHPNNIGHLVLQFKRISDDT